MVLIVCVYQYTPHMSLLLQFNSIVAVAAVVVVDVVDDAVVVDVDDDDVKVHPL